MKCKNCGQENPPGAGFCSQCGTPLSTVSLEPGVESAYSHGWRQLWKNFLELFLILIVSFVISLPFSILQWAIPGAWGFGFFNFVYGIFIGGPVGYGVSFAYLKAAREEKVQVADMFAAFKNYWNAVLASLLVGIIVFIGLVVFIIPGIFFACKLVFTPYLVVDRKMEVIEAIKTSWNMTDGHGWTVFLIGLLAIPIFIAGFICLGVGAIISAMWVSMAFATLYYAVSASVNLPRLSAPASPPQLPT